MSFTAAIPTTGEKVNLTFSGSVGSVDSSQFPVVADGAAMELTAATGSGTAWSLPLSTRSGWVPSGQSVKVTDIAGSSSVVVTNSSTVTQAQRRYVERGFGIFVHFTSSQYGTSGAITLPYVQAIDMPSYNMDQWFTSVIVPSGARYAVLTAKHDGGYCLWPTASGTWNISQTAFGVAHPGADLVRDWVRLCRKYNLGVGLYLNWYDPWWTTSRPGADGGYTNPAYITYMNQQITELFSNYGKIDLLWIDSLAYRSEITYSNYPWANLTGLRNSLQPACLLVNNAHEGTSVAHTDIVLYEGDTGGGGATIPASSNLIPSEFAEDSRVGSPNDPWIWTAANENNFKDVYSLAAKVAQAKTARCAYLLNFPANNSGLQPIVSGTYAAQLGGIIGRQGANPVEPALPNVRAGVDRGDGQLGVWGGGINGSAILGVL
jgi:alpha-L-fucosidase